MSVAFKFQYHKSSKWCKIPQDGSLESYVLIAKQKFPEVEALDIYFTDHEGCILEEDFLHDYITTNSNKMIIIKNKQESILDQLSTVYTSSEANSSSTISVDSDIGKWLAENAIIVPDASSIEIPVQQAVETPVNQQQKYEFVKPYNENELISVDDYKDKILKKGGQDIFQYYVDNKILSNHFRRMLVNLTVDMMINIYGYKPNSNIKIHFAKLIITLFPNLKDHEAFFSPVNGGQGFLAWRLRTVIRSKQNISHKRKRSEISTKEMVEPKKQKTEIEITEEIKSAIHFLKNACCTNDLDEIFTNMKLTFTYRKEYSGSILKLFPRFGDTPGLIEQDFQLMHPSAKKFEDIIIEKSDCILDSYKKTEAKLDADVVNEDGWDHITRAIFALLQMLPPTARGIKIPKESVGVTRNKLILFKPNNLSNKEILKKRTTSQPFLIAEGSNFGAITNYFVVADGIAIPCVKSCNAAKAFATLFQTHYVFQMKYDTALESFWRFVQCVFFQIDIDDINFTPKMRELRSRINALTDH